MAINIRTKGQTGEREVQHVLEEIVRAVITKHSIPLPIKPIIQRNQNQSAVGGKDLTGTFGLAIEVKRQEQLAINTWWKQCYTAAAELEEHPVLLYRQNGKKWRCVTLANLDLDIDGKAQLMNQRVEMDFDTFKEWFYKWVERALLNY